MISSFFSNFFCIFFYKLPCDHNLVPAAHALQPEIRSHPEDLPLTAAARMLFFQFYDVTYFVYSFFHNFFLFCILFLTAYCFIIYRISSFFNCLKEPFFRYYVSVPA